MDSLDNFNKLIEITSGFNGNRIYNKIARVSASRLLLSMEKHDEALEMIDLYLMRLGLFYTWVENLHE